MYKKDIDIDKLKSMKQQGYNTKKIADYFDCSVHTIRQRIRDNGFAPKLYPGSVIHDLRGIKFSKLTVLEYSHVIGTHHYWKVRCDCGTEKTIRANNLRSGTKSCGCARKGRKCNSKYGNSALGRVYTGYKTGAKARGYNFDISIKQFEQITQQLCSYCGTRPTTQKNTPSQFYIYNGIDRVDNTKGYTSDNIVPCCELCNRMKSTRSQQQFIEQCEHIVNYQKQLNN